uniref:Uncharacterized protein LOC104210323 n=1 Tax=Nicotiana sylvestris TaxID=4096 RepID=A0A1U7UMV1_NICSY|nr:PREDICTED: uncharacterized protein LOC104210323 [Nicotiana sylvestris]
MMCRIIENSNGHTLKNKKILQLKELSCAACSQGKLVIKPSAAKVGIEFSAFLERIQDAFTNLPRVTKSHIPVINAPIRVDVPTGQCHNADKSRSCLKHGRPIGSKDKNHRKKKGANDQVDHNMEAIAQEEH